MKGGQVLTPPSLWGKWGGAKGMEGLCKRKKRPPFSFYFS